MQEYTSPNSDLILKKTNSIVGQKITDFPQYKSALPKDFKYPRNDLQNIQSKEWFDEKKKKKLKSVATFNAADSAKTNGFIFLPNYRFKSIASSLDLENDKTIIKTDYGINIISDNLLNVLTKVGDSEYKNTIAIQYEGSSQTSEQRAFYKRQILYEDIEPIPKDNILENNENAGIYLRHLSIINNMSPEKYDKYQNLNNNLLSKLDTKNLHGLMFIARFKEDNWYTSVYGEQNRIVINNQTKNDIKKYDIAIYKLIQVEKYINKYKIMVYSKKKDKWLYITVFMDIKGIYSIGKDFPESDTNLLIDSSKNIISFEINTDNTNLNSIKINSLSDNGTTPFGSLLWSDFGGGDWEYTLGIPFLSRESFLQNVEEKHIIILPSMKEIYSKIFNNIDMEVSIYSCMEGSGTDELTNNLIRELGLFSNYRTSKTLTSKCTTNMNMYCGVNISGNNFPNLFKDECITYCNDKNSDCDTIMRNYCSKNKPSDPNAVLSEEYLKKCGCFMGSEFYDKYRSQFPSGYQFPTCEKKWIYPFCLNASMQDKSSKKSLCTSNIVNCIQEVKVNNSGKIIGDIRIDQTTSVCKQLINPPSTSPPSSPSSSPSSTGTNFIPGGPPTSPTSPTSPIPPPDLKPPAPPPAEKIMGLEKNVFYGVSAGTVILLLIIIGFMASRSSN
jgi:hypothetical protein